MAWGERAAEQCEKDQPSELVRTDEDADQYDRLLNGVSEAEQEVAKAKQALWTFIECRAERGVRRPYKVCGSRDAWHPRHLPTHPLYDEDDLVPSVECLLPEGHQNLGYRNHLEMKDGEIMGAWG